MDFPLRRTLIKEAQRSLGLRPVDGIDGRQTWHAIGTRALPTNHPALRPLAPRPGAMDIRDRRSIVAAVQATWGATVDGIDGPETWSVIMSKLTPIPSTVAPIVPKLPSGGYPEVVRGRSPNRNQGTNECKGIIIHHCAGTFEGTIAWAMRERTFAAYHCLVRQDGLRAILGHDTDRLHHAGQSNWRGRSGCNAFMLGISVTGNTVTGARRPSLELTSDELESVAEWCEAKMKIHGFPRTEITTHWAVSPGRKDDISKTPAWEQLKKRLHIR